MRRRNRFQPRRRTAGRMTPEQLQRHIDHALQQADDRFAVADEQTERAKDDLIKALETLKFQDSFLDYDLIEKARKLAEAAANTLGRAWKASMEGHQFEKTAVQFKHIMEEE